LHAELYFDRGNNIKFTTLVRELESSGALTETKSYPFEFSTEKPYESYRSVFLMSIIRPQLIMASLMNSGLNVRLRYFIRVTISRNYGNSVTKERDFAVQNVQSVRESCSFAILVPVLIAVFVFQIAAQAIAAEPPSQAIKMEVGIEDCLHIEFEYDKQKYHLKVRFRADAARLARYYGLFFIVGCYSWEDLLLAGEN
jgi:vacuolar protein sorting-associated protein 26